MLRELYIENLAVIEKAVIQLTQGFNVFTGETGAGKSILINGINAVLGQRTNKDIVRTGCKKAVVSALFDIDKNIAENLSDLGIDSEEGQILISREINSDGRSVARINSRVVNVSVIREIGSMLVNIHGQHDNQILLSPEKHISILDSFGELESDKKKYHDKFRKLQDISRKIKNIKADESSKKQRIAYLTDVVNEIEGYNLTEDEDIIVNEEYDTLKNSASIRQTVFETNSILVGTDDEEGVDALVLNAARNLSLNSELHKKFDELAQRLNAVSIEISDISDELNGIADSLDIDPQRFDWLSDRKEDIRKITRKYGPDLKDVLQLLESSLSELNELRSSDSTVTSLIQEQQQLLKDVTKLAKELSEKRKAAADKFTKQVISELEFLNMPNVKIVVDFKTGKLMADGMDIVEFLISSNIGEEPKPIAKIASGGELSRIMLALKNVIADKDNIPTLIFDEIDTGVSGRAAQKIGLKLSEISSHRQVICVTHLAQIAIMGDNHILIEKQVHEGRTITKVRTLENDERKYEIARIMGGDNVSELLLKNAEEMLLNAKK